MFLVTGGAGFIGSVLVKRLAGRERVVVVDNLCSGSRDNLKGVENVELVNGNICDKLFLSKLFAAKRFSRVYHFAADPDVRSSTLKPESSFNNNVVGTFNILEEMRKNDVKSMVFASTSTVYGDSKVLPTPETAPLEPISNYAASKLCCEAYCRSYASSYGIKSTVLRYANVFGPPSRHGVLFDFFVKLKKDCKRLEILGDGSQKKSYLFVDDAVDATLLAEARQKPVFDVFNAGSGEAITVKKLADLLCIELGVKPVYVFSGGKRGWVGDVAAMFLSTVKLNKLGWKSKHGFSSGLKKYVKWLSAEC